VTLRIGLSQRRLPASANFAARDALDAEWASWLAAAWPTADYATIPNFERAEAAAEFFDTESFDMFVLTGGNDVGSSPERDATERALLRHARAGRVPVLGVCRGMQMLHVHSGGGLVRQPGHVGIPHAIRAGGVSMRVNSFHHYAIERVQPGWRPLASAGDGTIEAMRHDDLPWLGLMWHPERPQGDTESSRQWIEALFAAAS
jgi:putative glutamine amidotransferase